MERQYRGLFVSAALGALLMAGIAPPAFADLLFDRGLPTSNLNNAAGSNRSNVAWADTGTTVSIGDNFTLTGTDTIDTIRVWVIDSTPQAATSYELWLGNDSGASSSVAQVEASTSVTQVTYANGDGYQGSGGGFLNIYQVDFSGLDLTEAPGTYAFSVSGPNADIGAGYTPFLSASNGPLSGSPQMGDDGLFYGFTATGAMDTGNGYPADSDQPGFWDKSSDVNVQVFGTVPEPGSLALLGAGLLGLVGIGLVRRRRA